MFSATAPALVLAYGEPVRDTDDISMLAASLVLLAVGLGVLLVRRDKRARIGGVLLLLWAAMLFLPSVVKLV